MSFVDSCPHPVPHLPAPLLFHSLSFSESERDGVTYLSGRFFEKSLADL